MPEDDQAQQQQEAGPRPPIYEESSQYRHWRFSPEQLWDIRKASHEAAVERVKKNIEEELKSRGSATTEGSDLQYLSTEEELALCRFHEKQLQSICRHFKFTDSVMATAVIYMKRFFLYNSMMDYLPKDVLLTCLFLATKSESERISIDQFQKNLELASTERILALEFIVSQGLRFEYMLHHPYRPAYGLFLDLQTSTSIDIKHLKAAYNKAQSVISTMLLTDLPLIYQPSQLAAAAFMVAGKPDGLDKQIIKHMEGRIGKEASDNLAKMAVDIARTLDRVAIITLEEAKTIDRKLRICMNPAKNPDSAL
ncbi:cyclin-like protein [Dichotomocladium elegans]|nr:cyclin-like protein [Dichotomocladium elegans]